MTVDFSGRIARAGFAIFALALAACTASAPGQAAGAGGEPVAQRASVSPAGLDVVPLTITGDKKSHDFRVEVARTSADQARGLMFRTELGANDGMIFPFPSPRPASFWMKNTVISLDIIFIREDGTIESIADRTEPYSLEPVMSGEPVAAVLEIPAGRSEELGIKPGDRVRWIDPAGPVMGQ